MPLLNGKRIELLSNTSEIAGASKVFQIRFTGEIFQNYEDYSLRLDFYRQPKFACKYSGKSGLSFENAIDHENNTKSQVFEQIPEEFMPFILREIQFSQLKVTDLVNAIYAKLANECNAEKKRLSLRKNVIRCAIRIFAKQHNSQRAPWILDEQIAQKYNISTSVPLELAAKISAHSDKRKRAKWSTKCDDEQRLKEFDAFWKKIEKIGILNGGQMQIEDESNVSNLAFFDFCTFLDDDASERTKRQKHRKLNDLFAAAWKLWSFVAVFCEQLRLSPFPISFFLDALCSEQRCILMDELHRCLLEIIRKGKMNETETEIFGKEPVSSFRLDLLRKYLQNRCDEGEHSLDDVVWHKLSNLRRYASLSIDQKLQILDILFLDAMSTQIVSDFMAERIGKYQANRAELKRLDDECANALKKEKKKLKALRSELMDKKRRLNPKKCKKSRSNSPNKENRERATSRQQSLAKLREEKEKKLQLAEIEKFENLLKESRTAFDEKCRERKVENAHKKWKILRESRTCLMELGMDRMRNKYFWSKYGDGRIFVFHSNSIFHQVDRYKDEKLSICKEAMLKRGSEGDFCWSFVSKSSDFYALLSILDERKVGESELLLNLNALKNDIVRSMALVQNDDCLVEDDDPSKLRRSKRAAQRNEDFVQSARMDFTSYRNKLKRK